MVVVIFPSLPSNLTFTAFGQQSLRDEFVRPKASVCMWVCERGSNWMHIHQFSNIQSSGHLVHRSRRRIRNARIFVDSNLSSLNGLEHGLTTLQLPLMMLCQPSLKWKVPNAILLVKAWFTAVSTYLSHYIPGWWVF